MKLLSSFIFKLLLLYFCCFSLNAQAKDILIGASLNLSGVNAQYSIDYKKAIEAYFESYNKLAKLKKYQLKLLVLDDQGVASRAKGNIERLITRKQVIAILNPYQGHIAKEIIQTSVSLETLVLSSTSAPKESLNTKERRRYSYYFSTLDIFSPQMIEQWFENMSLSSEKLYYLADEKIKERIKTVDKKSERYIDKPLTDLPIGTAIIIEDDNASIFINDAFKTRPDFHYIVIPAVNEEAFIASLDKTALKNITFIVDIPLHQQQLPLLIEASAALHQYKEVTLVNSPSIKGVLAAKIIAESVFHVVNTLQAESLVEVITIPFQVLERMIGWVKHSTSDLDRELIIDEIRNLKSFEIGLEQTINHKDNGLGLDSLWLLKVSNGQLTLRGNE